jgi:hypothetical protein
MNLDEPVRRETSVLAFTLVLNQLHFVDLMKLPPKHQLAMGASAGLTPEAMTSAVEQLGAMVRARAEQLLRDFPSIGQRKPS